MVIQRWQTVFLFIAVVAMVLFIILPFANVTIDDQIFQVKPSHFIGYLTLNIVIALMLFISIFLYRNIRFQKKITLISIIMIAVSAVTGGLCLYGPQAKWNDVSLIWEGGILLLIISLILALMAYRRMTADQKLLSDSGRIR